jgi:hypothetical protein
MLHVHTISATNPSSDNATSKKTVFCILSPRTRYRCNTIEHAKLVLKNDTYYSFCPMKRSYG